MSTSSVELELGVVDVFFGRIWELAGMFAISVFVKLTLKPTASY